MFVGDPNHDVRTVKRGSSLTACLSTRLALALEMIPQDIQDARVLAAERAARSAPRAKLLNNGRELGGEVADSIEVVGGDGLGIDE